MAVVVTVAQRKGGAGKTTLCCHLIAALAATGRSIAAIDADDQKSLTAWAARRTKRLGGLDFVLESGAVGVASAARRARESAIDVVFIDTPPTDDATVRRAIAAADLVLAPLQLSPLDLDACLPTVRAIGLGKREALFVVNRAPARARVAERIRAEMKKAGLPVAAAELGNRAAFAESLAFGQGASEAFPSSLAATEAHALAAELAGRVGLKAPRRRAA